MIMKKNRGDPDMLPLKPEVGGGGSQSLRFYSWFVSRMPADAEDPSCCGSVQDVAEPHRSFGSLDCYDCLGRCGPFGSRHQVFFDQICKKRSVVCVREYRACRGVVAAAFSVVK